MDQDTKWASVQSGEEAPILPQYRCMKAIATCTTPGQPLSIKVEYFNEEGVGKSFNSTIDRAKDWLKRWKR